MFKGWKRYVQPVNGSQGGRDNPRNGGFPTENGRSLGVGGGGRSRGNGECYNCRQMGHIVRNCMLLKQGSITLSRLNQTFVITQKKRSPSTLTTPSQKHQETSENLRRKFKIRKDKEAHPALEIRSQK